MLPKEAKVSKLTHKLISKFTFFFFFYGLCCFMPHGLRTSQEEDNRKNDNNNDDDGDECEEDLEDEGGSTQIKRRGVIYGSHLVQGKMDHGMEDYIVAEERYVDDHKLGLFAIFDGHSGRDVAEYLQSHLFDNILSQVKEN